MRSSRSEHRAEQHHLALEIAAEKILVALVGARAAGRRMNKSECRRHHLRSSASMVLGTRPEFGRRARRRAVRRHARRAASARRHSRHRDRLAIHHEAERDAPDHLVGVSVNVEGADITFRTDRGALTRRRQERPVPILRFARERSYRHGRRAPARAGSRGRTRAPARPRSRRRTATADCSMEVGNTTSKPTPSRRRR